MPDNEHNEKPENKDNKNLFFTGDNLEVLRHLQQNYANSVDFIYIDPPYNTGSDGFVYPDNFEYTDEQLKNMFGLNDEELKRLKSIQGKSTHSAWLAFMYPRLYLAKKLLKNTGVIFISIDDNEQANLKLLMDDVFGEGSFVATIPVINNLKGNQDQFAFAGTHEYLQVFSKDINIANFNNLLIDDESIEEWQQDVKGYFKKGATLKRTGADAPREKRPFGYFPILINQENGIESITQQEYFQIFDKKTRKFNDLYLDGLIDKYKQMGKKVLCPMNDIEKTSWRWGYEKVKKDSDEIIIIESKGEISLYKKQRPDIGGIPTKKPKSFLYKPEYSSGNGTNEVKKLFGDKLFPYPKSTNFIKDLLQIGTKKDSLILDFFAGSATTADAVMQLNAEDDGNRRYMMVQLPEPTKGDSAAYKTGYTSIDQISRARIEKAAAKIKIENPLLTDKQDLGFKHYQVVDANQQALDKIEYDGDMQLDMFDDMITLFSSKNLGVEGNASGFDTILQTYLASDNYKFDVSVEMHDFDGIQLPYINEQRVYIISNYWKANNTKALVNAIGTNEISVQTIVVYGYTMEMESLRELEIALNQLENKVNLLVRY